MPQSARKYRASNAPGMTDEARKSSSARGYTYKWQKESKRFLSEHPLCVHCESEGRVEVATVVDHKIPHRGNPSLFWDESNWQACCKRHHDQKTAKGG